MRVVGIFLLLIGLLMAAMGIAMQIWNGAETWKGPAVVGGGFALLGVFVAISGWLAFRPPR